MADQKSGADKEFRVVTWEHKPGVKDSGFPWGPHKPPIGFNFSEASIELEKGKNSIFYRRSGLGESVEKIILSSRGRFYFSPVEPLHIPAEASMHLMVELEQPLLIEPKSAREIMITFPLEIGSVYERRNSGQSILDLFTLTKPKLSLYGGVKTGLVCKYWRSPVHLVLPAVNPLEEGVIRLKINNGGGRWAEVSRVVFSAHAMKIYYNTGLVAMQAIMKINNETTAETSFLDRPLQPGMNRALEQFSLKMLGLPGRMVMEEGY